MTDINTNGNRKITLKERLFMMLMMTAGAFIYAVGISVFLDPHSLAPGGVTGISVIINHFTGIYTGILVLVINIPLMVLGMIRFGREFLFSTVYATSVSSVFMAVIEKLTDTYPVILEQLPQENLLLWAVCGGSLMGVGMGIIFRQGGTTGGSDILVKFLRQKYRHINSGTLFIILDMLVVIASAVAFRNISTALHAGVSVICCSMMFNAVLYGNDTARLVYIVSDKPAGITSRLLSELDLGVTFVDGEGGFTGKKKRVILCASKKRTFPRVKQIVREEDPEAFMIVSSANEIYGEGFKQNSSLEM